MRYQGGKKRRLDQVLHRSGFSATRKWVKSANQRRKLIQTGHKTRNIKGEMVSVCTEINEKKQFGPLIRKV